LLLPVVPATAALRTPDTVITANGGYHSETNPAALAAAGVPALSDQGLRRRTLPRREARRWPVCLA